jgi:TRAP-type C4-dicarboxylate transport system substrate-binding protein
VKEDFVKATSPATSGRLMKFSFGSSEEKGQVGSSIKHKRRIAMKKKWFSVGGVFILCLTVGIMYANSAIAAEQKVYEWKWYSPYDLNMSPSMDQFPKIIDKHTSGRVKVKLYVVGEHPFQGPDMPKAIKSGSCQIADVLPGYCTGIDPRLGAVDLPFIADSAEEEDALASTVLKNVTDKLYKDYGMVFLASIPFPNQAIVGNFLLKDWNSMKGKKVRAFNKVSSDMIIALGGSPVTIPMSEVYQALEKGIVDGALGNLYGHIPTKRFEVAKYATITNAYGQGSTYAFVVSKAALDELPKDLQAKVLEAGKEYQTIGRQRQYDDAARAAKEAKEKYGATVITLDPEFRKEIREKMKEGCWDKWAKTLQDGPALLAEVEKFHENWAKTHK